MNTNSLFGSSQNDRHNIPCDYAFSKPFMDFFICKSFAIEILHHQLFIAFCDSFDQHIPNWFDFRFHLGRNHRIHTLRSIELTTNHINNIYKALKIRTFTNWNAKWCYFFPESILQLLNYFNKVDIVLIHFIQENNLWHVSLLSEVPCFLSSYFNP